MNKKYGLFTEISRYLKKTSEIEKQNADFTDDLSAKHDALTKIETPNTSPCPPSNGYSVAVHVSGLVLLMAGPFQTG